MLKTTQLTGSDYMKHFFATTIKDDMIKCFKACQEDQGKREKSCEDQIVADIKAFGIYANGVGAKGKFAKVAGGSVKMIQDKSYRGPILHWFFTYLFSRTENKSNK